MAPPANFSPLTERRRWPRFKTQEDCLIFESGGTVGEVQDIGAGGLSFLTIYELSDPSGICRDGILCCRNIMLENIAFQVVSSTVLPQNFEFSTIVNRRYGLRFSNLTEGQQKSLQKIIETCQTS